MTAFADGPSGQDDSVERVEEWLTRRSRSGRPRPLRTSVAYAQLMHGEIGAADYARSLSEDDLDLALVRHRVSVARDAARDAHRAELSMRKAELFAECAGARRAAGHPPPRSRGARKSGLAFTSLFIAVITAFFVVIWSDFDAIPVAHVVVRSAGDLLPYGLVFAMLVTSLASLAVLPPLLRPYAKRR